MQGPGILQSPIGDGESLQADDVLVHVAILKLQLRYITKISQIDVVRAAETMVDTPEVLVAVGRARHEADVSSAGRISSRHVAVAQLDSYGVESVCGNMAAWKGKAGERIGRLARGCREIAGTLQR